MIAKMESKSLDRPDEVRNFDKGRLDIIHIGKRTVGRAVLEPGWKWSESVKPLVNTESCEAPHFQYHVSGTLRVRTNDGSERDFKAGDVSLLEAGHDAWVVGDEPVVIVDFQGMTEYAQERREEKS